MSSKSEVLHRQFQWAEKAGLQLDSRGYLPALEANLFRPLSVIALQGFDQGSGSELADTLERPAKIKALHSSAALAVNVFDYWTDRNNTPLISALFLTNPAVSIEFEKQYPTGLGGNPPNLDVAIKLKCGNTIAIESKFTEWLTPRPANKEFFRPVYFQASEGVWNRVGLKNCQGLAERIRTGTERFRYLDAPQLLKHSLGLATGLSERFCLYYVYYDWPGKESEQHKAEILRFSDMVGDELRLCCMTYQDLYISMCSLCGADNDRYLSYLATRYFPSETM